jgi:hypothetical protein
MRRTSAIIAFLFALLLPLAACGGDDDGREGADGGGDVQAYCEFSKSLDDQEDFPTNDQLDELSDLAPAEIADDINFVVDRFKDADSDEQAMIEMFDDPDVTERVENIEAFEERECGRDETGGDTGGDTGEAEE